MTMEVRFIQMNLRSPQDELALALRFSGSTTTSRLDSCLRTELSTITRLVWMACPATSSRAVSSGIGDA